MIGALKRLVKRYWPRLRLRTILLLTFLFVAALPGFGALFLRVYENTLVRQTEAELVAQGAALSAIASADWPGSRGVQTPTSQQSTSDVAGGALSTIDLRLTPILPERPLPLTLPAAASPDSINAAARLAPVLEATSRTTLASIVLLDDQGRVLIGPSIGRGYPQLTEFEAARAGQADTVLRRNADYRQHYAWEWLSRASDLRIHHARPVFVNGRVVAVLLLSRSPRALFRGLYEDMGKILFGVGVIFATLVVLSGLLSRGIARPIEALSEATREVARGSGRIPAPPSTAAIEIQALYADFAVMAEAIDRRSRYLRDFAHAVSHEFKTPLAGIRGAIELLDDHHATMSDEDRRRFLANAGADAERLALLVTRLLDLARADMAEADGAVSADVASSLQRLADAYASSKFSVIMKLAADLPNAAMPTATIEAAITGLIENSQQAGATCVSITVTATGQSVEILIEDDGPGIPPSDRGRVFEPFFTSRRSTGGTGLGLPITRSLLVSSGGSIEMIKCVRGVSFAIELPVNRSAP